MWSQWTQKSLTTRDESLFSTALELARNSELTYKHGAVIAAGSRILSMRVNKRISHPIQLRYNEHTISIHAEARAILNAPTAVAGTTLYSARVGKSGLAANSKPCVHCLSFMLDAGISAVVFSEQGKLVKVRLA